MSYGEKTSDYSSAQNKYRHCIKIGQNRVLLVPELRSRCTLTSISLDPDHRRQRNAGLKGRCGLAIVVQLAMAGGQLLTANG
jgi:hypothetical protein